MGSTDYSRINTIDLFNKDYLSIPSGNSSLTETQGIRTNGTVPPVGQPTGAGSSYEIPVPQQYAYVPDENGTKISQGQDGVGLAHKEPEKDRFMLIA